MTSKPTNSHLRAVSKTADDEVDGPDDRQGFHLDLERYRIEAITVRFWLLGIVVAALLAGLVATLLSTSLYRANARIEVTQITADVTSVDSLQNDSRISALQYLNTQYELLASKFMAVRVSDAGNLARDEAFLDVSNLGQAQGVTERDIQNVLLAGISVTPVEQSSLVDIGFSSSSPEVSAKIANLWAQEFIKANYEKRFGANIEARDFLSKQIAELRERLSASEMELVRYANANEILVLEAAGDENGSETAAQTLIASDLAALNGALASAVTDRIAAEASVVSGDYSSQDPSSALKSELAKKEAELASLRSNFGPKFPPLLEKEAEVASLRSSLTLGSRAALRSAASRERELQRKLEQAKGRFLGQQELTIQYGILKREVDTNRQLYDALLQRFKELEASGAGQNNIELIDPADVPDGPYSPKLLQNMLIALAVGLAAAAGLVYLRVLLSQTVKDPQDVTR